jgi:Arc/MetJ family transcription regulator
MHKIMRPIMRTTLDIPENLMNEALLITHSKTKTELIKLALENIIQKNKIMELKNYRGKINLDVDLNSLRKRG